MLTLFMTISGGINWGETFRPLIDARANVAMWKTMWSEAVFSEAVAGIGSVGRFVLLNR